MIKVTSTERAVNYVAASEVARIVDRPYSGGGSVVILKDGSRIETYEGIDALHTRVSDDFRQGRV